MKNKPVAVVLGGTFPHIQLIRKLKQRGYYTILVDYYDNPPAKREADLHIKESTLDKGAVLIIARENKAKLIISTCIDQANVTACYVAEKLGLNKPYSFDTALTVSNKLLMKAKMLENNIPTSKYFKVSDLKDIDNIDLDYPVIVKPTDSNSSKGVRKADNYRELREYLQDALKISIGNEAIIEQFKVGKEIGLDCIIKDKKVSIILSRERKKIRDRNGAIQQIYGSFWPADIPNEVIQEFETLANRIANVFDLNNTPLLIQAIVNDEGINIIEFAPRIGGGENYRIIEMNTGYDIISAGINSFLNEEIKLDYHVPKALFFDNYIYSKEGKFGNTIGFEQIVEDGMAEYFNIYKSEGMQIGEELSSNNRIGVFTVKADDRETLQKKISMVLKTIEVYDIDGQPIMRKDIY
jgi:biotin carboxylase